MVSAIRDVNRLSIEPSSAMVSAGWIAPTNTPRETSGNSIPGRPVGTSLMTGVSVNHRTPSRVPAINAASAGGRTFFSRLGQATPTPRVTNAMASALKLTLSIAPGQARIDPSGPPVSTDAPKNGRVCTRITITPMPDMNPDITE